MFDAPIENVPTIQQPARRQPYPYQTPGMPPRIKLGFTIAGMCFASGALLLILVAVMAQSLPSTTTNTQVTPPAKTSTANRVIATPTTAPRTPIAVTPTSTPMLSPASYIDNVNLASAVNTSTGTPLTESNTFHVGQSVYITMTLNQPAYNGAVCLNWSVNNNGNIPYNTMIGNSDLAQTNAYFFFKPGSTGPGQVDVYWSSSTACVTKVLIQHETFTVLP
jgi:hypothetical protein